MNSPSEYKHAEMNEIYQTIIPYSILCTWVVPLRKVVGAIGTSLLVTVMTADKKTPA